MTRDPRTRAFVITLDAGECTSHDDYSCPYMGDTAGDGTCCNALPGRPDLQALQRHRDCPLGQGIYIWLCAGVPVPKPEEADHEQG